MKSSQVQYLSRLPRARSLGSELILIYDKVLDRKVPAFRQWRKQFSSVYPVSAGEDLKSVESFARHIRNITALADDFSVKSLKIVVVGGGSVGDFGGFVASVLKRGVGLIHIPSTWLAAIDSAHGGKTALNVGAAKNQIGTFYPSEKTLMVRELLMGQPSSRAFEAFSEILKVALLQGGAFWKSLSQQKNLNSEVLWKFLPKAVQAKKRIFQKDPLEKSGHRHLLNFGHTMGHVWESAYKLPHGVAVNYGLDFAIRWSCYRGLMSQRTQASLREAPVLFYLLSAHRDQLIKPAKLRGWKNLLLKDKKKSSSRKIRFIFLRGPGRPAIEEVRVEEILKELERQYREDRNG